MLEFEPNSRMRKKMKAEVEIMNSNPAFNRLARGRETIGFEEVESEFQECERRGVRRLLVKKDRRYVAVIDYCLQNPSDSEAWISLFVVHGAHQGTGVAHEAYGELEALVGISGRNRLRLAVHASNEAGLAFWMKKGFQSFKEVDIGGKPHYCLEKEL